ncbi:MAG TPA: AAA family ATPase [Blastocatellia bacterium]|nr:AAA family ATPase [Blastocatellia bacterium]
MARKYYAGEATHYLLHHNIFDLQPIGGGKTYDGLRTFLHSEMLGNKNIVMYNRSEGLTFVTEGAMREFQRTALAYLRVQDPVASTDKLRKIPKDPATILPLLEQYLFHGKQAAIIINFFETIIPASEMTYLSPEERNILVTLQRWLSKLQLLESDNIAIFVTENLSDIHPRLRENSRLVKVKIPYPELNERQQYIKSFLDKSPGVKLEMSVDQLAHMTSGLNRIHINSMLKTAGLSPQGLTYEIVREKKKELIESECVGLVEFATPKFGLDSVGGMDSAKEFLRNIANTIREGTLDEAPMGILFSGPVGTGKTFLAECFAKDCGLNVVIFKNFREKWVGSSEANLEKILNLLQTLAPIVVLIDEADATLGNRDSGGDSGVDSRIFSKLANFMGNTDNRGKILWILMTSRPDLLPIDLKRQGRCEEHLSLFYPEGELSRQQIVDAMVRKNNIAHEVTDWAPITKNALPLSGADIEAILIRSRRVARNSGHKVVRQEDLDSVAREFTPARDETAVEYQTLVAVRESTSREMLPEAYKHKSAVEINRRIEELRPLII